MLYDMIYQSKVGGINDVFGLFVCLQKGTKPQPTVVCGLLPVRQNCPCCTITVRTSSTDIVLRRMQSTSPKIKGILNLALLVFSN